MIDRTKRTMGDGIFQVIVHNANKIPLTERFRGLPDPYVNLFYHGSFILNF
jgi:hypothetical protein